MEAVAKLRNCPMSPRKMRLVVDNIRGVEVDKALNILKFTRKEASTWLEKVVLSAIANWDVKAGEGVDADEYNLYIKTVFVDEGAMLKRFRPAPFGRAHRIRKRTNHVTIIVENRELLASEEGDYVEEGAVEIEEVVNATIDNQEEDNKA
jgi:large subunit ribosomal protein L22